MIKNILSASVVLGFITGGASPFAGCVDTGEEIDETAQGLAMPAAANYDLGEYAGVLEPSEPQIASTSNTADEFVDNRTHTCQTGNSKDDCASFTGACKKYTGYDASSSRGDNLSSVVYSCSCDGPQVANQDFCDGKIKAANQ